ncbi:NADPH:quinone oxidoreductase [Sphingobium sp. C100]|uniref:NADPH:quinone oxidoreductase family protein n=1 Tax=Sphingobium sp. C100 TaxID=1207055 RepID=UPI0003D5CA72|nr:NADPH:quinone oxidoreductase family protein [Sphingobium sp. C100]ETI61185.1 NADPH:quinone oxidoreductase [Sphingobium sp. C100]
MTGEMMKALLCERHGPPEDLILTDTLRPVPGPGQLLIAIEASGLNFPDALIIQDKYQMKPALPFSPGGEAAGTVAAVGEGVERLRVGDRVATLTNWGTFADYVVAPAEHTTIVPDSMDLETAGVFTLAYGTSHHALKQRAMLKPGETLLVLGAAGGVGLAAVEIGKAMGAHVIAAASSTDKLEIARRHGADELVNYGEVDLKATVKALTGGKGVDVVFDPVGDRLADPAFRSIGWEGRYLVIGFAGGNIPTIPLNLPLVKGASIVGVFWGDFVARTPDLHRANMDELYHWHSEGKLAPLISARFPLERGGEAIRWMMERKAVGKVVVTVGGAG